MSDDRKAMVIALVKMLCWFGLTGLILVLTVLTVFKYVTILIVGLMIILGMRSIFWHIVEEEKAKLKWKRDIEEKQ
jgi:hypothetical protein